MPPCLYAKNNSKWPIRCYAKLNFNVNSHHGGCAGLYFNSCAYGGKGEESTAEIFLVKFGFDCNHIACKSIVSNHQGHFGSATGLCTDEEGTLIADCLFGSNDCMLMTNDGNSTTLSHGVYAEGQGGTTVLPVNVNGTDADKGHGGGAALVLCTGEDGQAIHNALYLVRSGFKDNKFQNKIITGEEKFTFGVDDKGVLNVSGPGKCSYSIFYNRKLPPNPSKALVALTQSVDGKKSEMLLENVKGHASLVVLCSNSNDTEDNTVSSVYFLSTGKGQILESKEIAGLHALSYTKSDLWHFELVAGQLLVTGPAGPCRYAVLSNYKDGQDVHGIQNQDGCLATGEKSKLSGEVKVDMAGVDGFVDKESRIEIKLNQKIVRWLKPDELIKENGIWRFYQKWTEDEKFTGIGLVRVYAVRKHVKSKHLPIEPRHEKTCFCHVRTT